MLLGVNVAIFDNGKVLLTKRDDFHVWCMPGGHVDDNESLAQAAMREVREETGLEVRLTRLVGTYSRPGWKDGGYHIITFAGEVMGGELSPDPHEVVDIAYFDVADLPPLLIGQRQRILDAAAGYGGAVAWSEDILYPAEQPASRQALYAARDASGLARDAFYRRYFTEDIPPGTVEVRGRPAE